MIDGRRVLALIAARGGSKGLPRKNVRLLGGRPLVAWPVSTAVAARSVDRVAISTDDEEIAAAARAAGADVPFMRPAALASDSASSIAVALHALEMLAAAGHSYDYLVLLEPTSPLTEPQDVDRALARRAIEDEMSSSSALPCNMGRAQAGLASSRGRLSGANGSSASAMSAPMSVPR